jgi:CheY-like chemotaxis protein
MEETLRALLDISRLESGALMPRFQAVELGPVLADLAADYAPLAARRRLGFTVMPSRLVIQSDPAMLARVLRNFVSNALRYTRAGHVLVGARGRGEWVRIDVIDTGPGIPESQQEAIFEEFHRGRAPVPDGEVSLGLGLAIVRRLADTLGHAITLASRPGHGSRFSVAARRTDRPVAAEAAPTAPAPIPSGGLAGAIVVVIDNDSAVREAAAALLAGWQCLPVQAEGSRDAEAVTEEIDATPRLLLVDYYLDNETGLDAIAPFRAVFGASIPAIIMSGDASSAITDRTARAGMPFLSKPLQPDALRQLMASLLAPLP